AAPEPAAPVDDDDDDEDDEDDGPEVIRLFLNVGERDGFDADSLRDLLADLAGLWPEDFIDLDVRGRHSYVEVAAEYADDLVEAVNGETVGQRTLRAEPARD
ncbi:MAG: DbpA RNA binding domain-containing protein, partial [Myxococcales bacterium]|nr:DbpA RNA binding domain-containing protein [Myxococcales bacterium]